MGLEFCPKCESLLVPEKDGNKSILRCHHCNFSKDSSNSLVGKEKVFHEDPKDNFEGKISSQENEFATYDHKCQKCSYDKAEVIDIGSFYSDEDDVIFLKCGKCGWTERVGNVG